MQRYDDELARYEKAIEVAPDSAEAHNNRALILNKMKRYDEALASYGKAIALKVVTDKAGNVGIVFDDKDAWFHGFIVANPVPST